MTALTETLDGGGQTAAAEFAGSATVVGSATAAVKFAGAGTPGDSTIQVRYKDVGTGAVFTDTVDIFIYDPATAIESVSITAGSTGRAANFLALESMDGRASSTWTVSVADANGLSSPLPALLATSSTASLAFSLWVLPSPRASGPSRSSPVTDVGTTPTGMHTINLALASAPTVVLDTFEIEVVSAPMGVEFVSLVDSDGVAIAGPPFFVDALAQNVLTVRAFTADDADALVGTVVVMPFTGSGIVFGITPVGAGGASTAVVVGEDLGSTIIVLAGPGAVRPVEILRATVGEPSAAAPAGGAAMLGGFIGAPGGTGSAFFDGGVTPTEVDVTLGDGGCDAESLSVLTPGGWNSNRPDAPDLVNDLTGMPSGDPIGIAGDLISVVHKCA